MKSAQPKPNDELRMSAKEFDRIMGQALKVKPEAEKPKGTAKAKEPRRKLLRGA